VPKDAYELLRKDPVAFEYLYTQASHLFQEPALSFFELSLYINYMIGSFWALHQTFVMKVLLA
jgi:hypothetical protein